MARLEIEGVGLEYELLGPEGAQAVVITPGGRFSKDATGVPELGARLAEAGLRVLLWDRPNCGASDLHFAGEGESGMQAAFLAKLIRALDLGPVALIGGSAGARISLFAAKQNPEAVSHLALWWISGGLISMMRLGSYYCCEPADEAALKGMHAVAEMGIWKEQLARNPKNRDTLLGQDPAAFIAQMERWAWGYVPSPDTPVGGIAKQDFARMRMPALVLRGSPRDHYHPDWVCEQVAGLLPNARMADPPWDLDIFARRMVDGQGLFCDWPLLTRTIVEFLGK